MKDLIQMQKHLDYARAHIGELGIELGEQYAKEIKIEAQFNRTLLKYRIAVIVLLFGFIWVGLSNMEYNSVNENLKTQNSDLKRSDLPQRFDNVLNMLHIMNEENNGLRKANEQLRKHCPECKLNRAIKSTPLPALVRGA